MSILRRRAPAPQPGGGAPDAARAAYDAVAYPGYAFPRTHPGRLAAQAAIFGLDPAPVEGARVLELGCGDGGNLLPIAFSLPGTECVGIDLSAPALERGRATASELGVANIDLREGDLAALDTAALGKFDYVIAHGVYSWVPGPARDGLLAACRDCLRGDGVAYVSYNALPGGHLRAIARDAMLHATRGISDPEARLARARETLATIAGSLPGDDPYANLLKTHLARLSDRADPGLFHDDLAEVSEAFYFEDFVAHATRNDLRYLAESELPGTSRGNLDAPVAAALDELAGHDELEREQQLDFLQLKMFRETLLCRRKARRAADPVPAALDRLHAAAALKPPGKGGRLDDRSQVRFRTPGGAAVTTDHPAVKHAFAALGAAWPGSLPVADLAAADEAPAVRQALLAGAAAGLVTLTAYAPPVATAAGERPLASPFARFQAARGDEGVTTLRHEHVRFGDEMAGELFALLDGTRDRASLVAAMRERGAGADAPRRLEASLARLADLALLVRG